MATKRAFAGQRESLEVDCSVAAIEDALSSIVADPVERRGIAALIAIRVTLETMAGPDIDQLLKQQYDKLARVLSMVEEITLFAELTDNAAVSDVDPEYERCLVLRSVPSALENFSQLIRADISELQQQIADAEKRKGKRRRDPLHARLDELADQWARLGGEVSAGSDFRRFAMAATKPLWGLRDFPPRALATAVGRFNKRHGRLLGPGNPAFTRNANDIGAL